MKNEAQNEILEERTKWCRVATCSEIWAGLQVTSFDDVLNNPRICDIGEDEKQTQLVSMAADEIYQANGRPAGISDCYIFAKRFANRYGNYTIGDLKVFVGGVIEGDIELRYASVSDLFSAWKKYVQNRSNALAKKYEAADKQSRVEQNEQECAPQQMAEAISKRIQIAMSESREWWTDWLNAHPAGWSPEMDKGGRKWEMYRQYRCKEQAERFLRLGLYDKYPPVIGCVSRDVALFDKQGNFIKHNLPSDYSVAKYL